jgi:uncharacterized protein (DUF433 family)
MQLPDFLTEVEPGEIRLTGHRIGLYTVIRYHKEGLSPEQILEQLPTLSLEQITNVLAFADANRAEVDVYVDHYRQEIERQEAAYRPAVSYDELLRRYFDKKRAEKA